MSQTKNHNPPERDVAPGTQPSPENGGEKLPSDKTIGAFLRVEREKKGLSYEQLSEITKLRPLILEALENESWDSLSSPVLASSFVRSYGRALGLEEEKIKALFQKSRPVTDTTPKPLVEPERSKKTFIVVLIFVLLALIPVYFFWMGYSTHKKALVNHAEISAEEKKPAKPEKIQEPHGEIEPQISTEQPQLESVPETDPEADDLNRSDNLPEENMAPATDASAVATVDGIAEPELTLKAGFREETWLRIFVDDHDPEEYVFRPEEHFEWKAKKGFELLIGNATGIDLELNGTDIESFGTPGQVVRLRLPKGYKRKHPKE